MKSTIPFIVVLAIVLGCGKFGAKSTTEPSANDVNKSAPSVPTKDVDIPSLVGKSRDDLRKMLPSNPESDEKWDMTWKFPKGDLHISFNATGPKKGQDPMFIYYKFRPVYFGSSSISGVATPEELGDIVGIDVRGKKPTRSDLSGNDDYGALPFNGKTVKDVTFGKTTDGKYDEVTLKLTD